MAVFSCPDQASVPDGVVFDAIGYYRLSKFNKNTKSESIANQKKLIHEAAARAAATAFHRRSWRILCCGQFKSKLRSS